MMKCKKFWMILFVFFVLQMTGFLGKEVGGISPNDLPFPGPIFVLLYHPWEEGFESAFKDHLNWLKQSGYQTISLGTLIDYLERKDVVLPPKPILLTFDDGTIENYTIVYPMLQKTSYTGIAFVITGLRFVQYSKRFWWREVDRSGILQIENHSHTHGLIRVSPKIIDFYAGSDTDDYFLIKGMDWRLGAPIYEYDEELINVRYFPDGTIANFCVAYVAQNGGKDFFKREGWREELLQAVGNFRSHRQERGYYEREPQMETRIKTEIYGSKRIIEQMIGRGKQVTFFAYPWGAYDEALILRLKEYGYRGGLTIDWGGNFPGDDPFKIKRVTITSDMTVEDLADILKIE